jgi:ubiquinone/menaquinone biosynthesis C-methylase UbiE
LDHFLRVYRQQAAQYHALIAAEDADGNLPRAFEAITPLAGRRALDLGSGTGRIPLLLAGTGCRFVAVELQRAMLAEQIRQMELANGDWSLAQADIRSLPLARGCADVVIAGWAIGHYVGWYGDGWKGAAARALAEMQRTAADGGTLIILETLGTGILRPGAPNAGLAAYYRWLEQERGYTRQVISTDYQFESVEQAAELCGFFFGPEMAARVHANSWARVPEWTGIWHLSTRNATFG